MKIKESFKCIPWTKTLSLFLIPFFLTQQAEADDLTDQGVIVDTSIVWQSPPCGQELVANIQYSPLWHYNNSTYFVWIDDAYRPWVTKIKKGVVQTVPLDPNPDYQVTADAHCRFSMGIDKKGFIHITGDMHNYSSITTIPYPARYQQQTILYWKSLKSEDVTSGFAFVGGKDAPTAMPGAGFTYGRFFTDHNHELYYNSRIKAIEQRHTTGEMGLGLYKYNTSTLTWTALGGKAQDTRPGIYHNTLVWENGGMAPDGWYQGFLTSLKFDTRNTLHMAVTINSDNTIPGSDRLIYAYSNDSGLTWYKMNGQQITPLPLRAKDGLSNQADLVTQVHTAPFLDSKVEVMADKNGTPGILNTPLYLWDETNGWQSYPNKFHLADAVDVDNNGNLLLSLSGSAKILRAETFDSNPKGYDFKGYDLYAGIDEDTLRNTGVLYGVGVNGNTQTILKTVFTPAPLPAGWQGQEIAVTPNQFVGTSGFRNCRFVVNDYATCIDNFNDNFHYVYTTLQGNGMITAKVSMQISTNNSRSGLMMRESLDPSSRNVFTLFAPSKGSVVFGYRPTAANYPFQSWKTVSGDSQWLRLIREGNVFTSFVSSDGDTWTQTGTRSVPLATTLYVGLASASYHPFYMLKTIYDFVDVETTLPEW